MSTSDATKVEWTWYTADDGTLVEGYTVNGWWGCTKVSEGCANCYAETWARRWGVGWGPGEPRRLQLDSAKKKLATIARRAQRDGHRRNVFMHSMSDLFEDAPELEGPRAELLAALDDHGPALRGMLTTKRPEVALRIAQAGLWPSNAMLVVTAENQDRADERIPLALQVKALTGCLLGVSYEPAVGPLDVSAFLPYEWCSAPGDTVQCDGAEPGIDWLICGGESGPGARPMHPDWARSARDQCKAAGVPFFFKQWGAWLPTAQVDTVGWDIAEYDALVANGSGDARRACPMSRVGKSAGGRLLDGRTWDEVAR